MTGPSTPAPTDPRSTSDSQASGDPYAPYASGDPYAPYASGDPYAPYASAASHGPYSADAPHGPYAARGPYAPRGRYGSPEASGPTFGDRLHVTDPERRAAATPRVLLFALLTGLLTAWLLYDGVGANLLICGAAAAAVAGVVARAAGRRIRPWTVVWSLLALALLAVPACWDAGWPALLASGCALGLASLALHGGRRWSGVLLALPALLWQLVPGVGWIWDAMEGRPLPGRGRIVPVLKALAVAAVLLTVFGLLFASADAGMADLLAGLRPSIDVHQLPLRGLLFALGTLTALGFAHIAAGPRRWDRLAVRPGRERRRLEWALPLVALNLMFGAFAVIQAVVVLGGADALLSNTGMSRSEYARQGFWQLSVITVLTLVVVAVAKRWAPRTTPGDRRLARILLGLLCLLALVVVASALGRMWFYVDASGLTRLRLWVLVVEIWLGVVFLLLITAGLTRGTGWLPRAVVLSGMLTVAVYGLMGPDAIVAEQNVARYERSQQIDLRNVRELSADAVPALDRLPEPQRTCALQLIRVDLDQDVRPWYAAGASAPRARGILAERPLVQGPARGRGPCEQAGLLSEGRW
ncbi:DUF4173 domain-containing protein [Streptomyces viridifaciens]|nr:DUF4173 domain-containing protein [Streptomyces viridifaciens]UKZ05788.1 DUF4173 domain-containing protein [Streptomyces viridifaciens]